MILCIHTAWWNRIQDQKKKMTSLGVHPAERERFQTFRQGRGGHGLHVRAVGSPSILGTPGYDGTQRHQK